MTHLTQDKAYLKKLQLYIIFVERPVSSLILSTGLYFLLEKWRKNNGLLDKRQELSTRIEQMEQEKTAIEQQVKLKMQDAAYGTAPGYKVSWVSSESKRVDSQRLRKEQPDIFNQYSKNVSSRRFTIVHAA